MNRACSQYELGSTVEVVLFGGRRAVGQVKGLVETVNAQKVRIQSRDLELPGPTPRGCKRLLVEGNFHDSQRPEQEGGTGYRYS